MKKLIGISLVVLLLLGFSGVMFAGNTANHQVTVQVNAINEVALAGGNISLVISTATAGSDPDDATDNTTCDLDWTTNESSKKITVGTDNGSATYSLKGDVEHNSNGFCNRCSDNHGWL